LFFSFFCVGNPRRARKEAKSKDYDSITRGGDVGEKDLGAYLFVLFLGVFFIFYFFCCFVFLPFQKSFGFSSFEACESSNL
jgi:hypothetical protein